MAETLIGPLSEFPPGTVRAVGNYAVVNHQGNFSAVTRKCRHLLADLAEGELTADGCLVCPWHHAEYDTRTGKMTKGPQKGFDKVPGLGFAFKSLTGVLPLGRAAVIVRDGDLYLDA